MDPDEYADMCAELRAEDRALKRWRDRLAAHPDRRGKLTRQPCEVCGAESNIEAHHSDYSKPLDVNWLCREHHKEWHRNNDINKEAAS